MEPLKPLELEDLDLDCSEGSSLTLLVKCQGNKKIKRLKKSSFEWWWGSIAASVCQLCQPNSPEYDALFLTPDRASDDPGVDL